MEMDGATQSKAKSCKRQWTHHEDIKLVEALVELSTQKHWKVEGSGQFKSDYLKELERMLEVKMPRCGLKASPHIESKVKLLKKQYGAITEMLGPKASGFGWDDKEKKIVVENEIFNEWVKSHSNAIGLYNKSFPFFNELQQVYDKDRATGEDAEDPYDAVQAMEKEMQQNVDEHQESQATMQNEGLDEFLDNIANTQPPTPTFLNTQGADSGQSSATRLKKKTRNSNDAIENMASTMVQLGNFYEATKNPVMELASYFKHSKEGAERTMRVIEELKLVDGLTNIQRMMAAEIMTKRSASN